MRSEDGTERALGEIIYHFDIDRQSIPLKQFVDTARSSQTILDEFIEQVFDKKIRYELRVLPPEPGGFVEALDLIILSGAGAAWAALGTDVGKAYFKGLTGEEPSYWAEKLGQKTRKLLKKKATASGELSTEPEVNTVAIPIEAEIVSDADRDAELLVEFLISFLAANIDRLEKVGITPAKFRKAYAARNALYKACIDNPEIDGLSFDRSHEFPLKRADFPRLIAQIPDQVEVTTDAPMSWSVEAVDIVVNSPNWKRDGRKWQAATNKFQDIAFSVEDDTFWHHVQIKDIQPDIRDNMRVQWAYPAGLSKPSHVRVLRVLSYNGTKISDPMSEAELQTELEEASAIEPETPGLFDHSPDNPRDNNDGGED